ncbi:hypothetical protein [Streptomyces sp. NPDC059883]|uniref:hypothetical protein n=1 Tax=unclassified Streptomyces TaxID=2593676 RepID=UPI003649F6EA
MPTASSEATLTPVQPTQPVRPVRPVQETCGRRTGVQGAGSVLAGLVAGPLLRRRPERVFAAAGIALFATAVAARALPYDAVVPASAAGVGAGLPCVLIAALTAVRREVPAAVVGRTAATAHTQMYVPNALVLALGAGLIALADPAVLLPLTGAAGLLTAWAPAAPGHARRKTPRQRPPGGSATEV